MLHDIYDYMSNDYYMTSYLIFSRMAPPPNNSLSGTKYQEWTKVSLWKTAFKKFEVIWPAEADHIPLNS